MSAAEGLVGACCLHARSQGRPGEIDRGQGQMTAAQDRNRRTLAHKRLTSSISAVRFAVAADQEAGKTRATDMAKAEAYYSGPAGRPKPQVLALRAADEAGRSQPASSDPTITQKAGKAIGLRSTGRAVELGVELGKVSSICKCSHPTLDPTPRAEPPRAPSAKESEPRCVTGGRTKQWAQCDSTAGKKKMPMTAALSAADRAVRANHGLRGIV